MKTIIVPDEEIDAIYQFCKSAKDETYQEMENALISLILLKIKIKRQREIPLELTETLYDAFNKLRQDHDRLSKAEDQRSDS